MIVEKIYRGKGNINSLVFEEDGSEQDIRSATRITIDIADIVIDSNSALITTFDWSTYGANGRLDLKLGLEQAVKKLKPGKYLALVTIYDATYTNGLAWDRFKAEVI